MMRAGTVPAPSLGEKWRGLDPARRGLLIESLACLLVASLALAVLPFRRVVDLPSAWRAGRPGPVPAELLVAEVHWAVTAAARRLPWRALCFHQGLAAQMLLRRRGVASTLHYGARLGPGQDLKAHVWVTSGDLEVIGCESAAEFGRLASFARCETL